MRKWIVLLLPVLWSCGTEGAGEGGACTSGDDCADGLACIQYICTAESTPVIRCMTDGQCGTGKRCLRGTCVADSVECFGNEDCPGLMVCQANTCVSSGTSGCTQDDQCGTGKICEAPECVAGCQGPSDCPGQECVQGRCVAATTTCSTHTECDDGNDCTVDFCQNTDCANLPKVADGCCGVDADCNDGNPLTTDRCVDYHCQNMVNAQCQVDGDCDDGNPCTRGVCQDESCSFVPTEDLLCCVTDGDCDDGDPETTDRCIDNECTYLEAGSCLLDEDCTSPNPCKVGLCEEGTCAFAPSLAVTCSCYRNNDCAGTKGGACILYQPDPNTAKTVCADVVGTALPGESCVLHGQCLTGLCLGLTTGNVCFGGCLSNQDCHGQSVCSTLSLTLENGQVQEIAACVIPPATCTGDAGCTGGKVCSAVSGALPGTIDLACWTASATGTKGPGDRCTLDSECKSDTCMGVPELGSDKFCWSACVSDGDCLHTPGLKCYPNRLYYVFDYGTATFADDTFFGLAACLPDIGSYKACVKDSQCTSPEACYPYNNQTNTQFQPRCSKWTGGGTKMAGASCFNGSECRSKVCIEFSALDKYCFGVCTSGDCVSAFTTCQNYGDFLIEDWGDMDESNDITAPLSVCIPW